jgi:hypothetical protein
MPWSRTQEKPTMESDVLAVRKTSVAESLWVRDMEVGIDPVSFFVA